MENATESAIQPVKMEFYMYVPGCPEALKNPPIILIHGMFSSNSSWNRVKVDLGERTKRKVYAVILRNHGVSEWSDKFDLRHMVADLEHFMEIQDIPKAVLVGHSLAARVCLQLALKKPHMVEMLISEDTSVVMADQKIHDRVCMATKLLCRAIENLPERLSESEASKHITNITCKNFPGFKDETSNTASAAMLPFHKTKNGRFVVEMNVDVVLPALEWKNFHCMDIDFSGDPLYEGKAFMMYAEHTDMPQKEGKEIILKYFPNTQFLEVKKCYHCIHIEAREVFLNEVANFINST